MSDSIAVFNKLSVGTILTGEWGTKGGKPYPTSNLFAILEGDKTIFTFGTRKGAAIVQGLLQDKGHQKALLQYVSDNFGAQPESAPVVSAPVVSASDLDTLVEAALAKALAKIK